MKRHSSSLVTGPDRIAYPGKCFGAEKKTVREGCDGHSACN
jgi:hypothetical protein